MSIISQLGLAQIKADIAGVTGPTAGSTTRPSGLAPTRVQRFSHPLAFLSGGPHPDGVLTAYHDALALATDSLRGPHGGLVPRSRGTQAPGPSGPSVTAAGNAQTTHRPLPVYWGPGWIGGPGRG